MVEARLIALRNGLLLALAFAAGYIDALSYLGLGRVFTANMTGKSCLSGSEKIVVTSSGTSATRMVDE